LDDQWAGDMNMKLSVIRWVFVLLLCLSFGVPSGVAVSQEIQWHSFNAGMARGKFEKKKVFIHFYADWCAACKVMENSTFKDPVVIASLNENFIPIKVDAEREVQTASLFRVKGLPDNWFIAEDGEIIGHRPGFIPPDQLKNILTLMQNSENKN
jgi:thiol:disulfide interchange protein